MTLTETSISDLKLHRRGKVRDVYEFGDKLLLVATDRISAFDCILPTSIPLKGAVLTQISRFWFGFLGSSIENHLISADVNEYPAELQPFRDQLEWRSMLVMKTDVVPFECVVRGYLSGSGWKDYKQTGSICGIDLPSGLRESDRLPKPIFTPATKAESGHDINVSEGEMAKAIGSELTSKLRDLSLEIYNRAAEYAAGRGIIIADTKFEFGQKDGRLILIDEVLTPDSSRFWPAAKYDPGHAQQSFDKQFVRDYLESLVWDKRPPAPPLPPDVVKSTSERYLEAYRILTGQSPPFETRNS
jgi:phosphoribosylaminoimidazole-succinocarboxamide synthase